MNIDRLSLDVPGLSRADGQRLGALVAERLRSERWEGTAASLSLAMPRGASTSLDELAGRIVAELRRQMSGQGDRNGR